MSRTRKRTVVAATMVVGALAFLAWISLANNQPEELVRSDWAFRTPRTEAYESERLGQAETSNDQGFHSSEQGAQATDSELAVQRADPRALFSEPDTYNIDYAKARDKALEQLGDFPVAAMRLVKVDHRAMADFVAMVERGDQLDSLFSLSLQHNRACTVSSIGSRSRTQAQVGVGVVTIPDAVWSAVLECLEPEEPSVRMTVNESNGKVTFKIDLRSSQSRPSGADVVATPIDGTDYLMIYETDVSLMHEKLRREGVPGLPR